jgi:hypothetical protein
MAAGLGVESGPVVSAIRLFASSALAKNGSLTSGKVRVRDTAINGNFSVAIKVAGAGQVDIGYLLSPDDSATYIAPSAAVSIVSNFTSASGKSGYENFYIGRQCRNCGHRRMVINGLRRLQ